MFRMFRGHNALCQEGDPVDAAHEYELGLHIAALFAILLASTFGNSPSME